MAECGDVLDCCSSLIKVDEWRAYKRPWQKWIATEKKEESVEKSGNAWYRRFCMSYVHWANNLLLTFPFNKNAKQSAFIYSIWVYSKYKTKTFELFFYPQTISARKKLRACVVGSLWLFMHRSLFLWYQSSVWRQKLSANKSFPYAVCSA